MAEKQPPKKGRPPKNAVARSERVNMMWTPDLKERVRERVGTRGLTDWVIDAVEEKLAAAPPRTIEEMRQHQERKAREADQPVTPPAPLETSSSWGDPKPSSPNGRPEPVLEPVTERFGSSTGGMNDLLSRASAMGVKTDDIQSGPNRLQDVQTPVQAPPIIVENACPTCGGELIDGECWTCD
jgi:hypothetical protein